jgi:hypothetical protein
MAKKVQLEVEVKGNDSVGKAAEATKNLKTQLRELQNDLQSGKLTGKAFDEGIKKAGQMKDQIKDVNNRVNALATDGADVLLRGFTDMATGIAGGFAAAQGAMALFGSENEDLQKTLVKLQATTALLNGLQAVNNALQGYSASAVAKLTVQEKIATFVKTRYAAAVGGATGAMKLFRIAGMALGIGAIIGLIALVVANFDKIKAVVMGVVDRFKNLGAGTKNLISVLFPIVGIIRLVHAGLEKMGLFAETAEDRYEKLEKTTIKQNKALEREIELMEAQGKSAREIFEAKAKLIKSENDLLIAKSKVMKLTDEELEKNQDLVHQMNILNAEETKRQNDELAKRQKDADDVAKKALEKKRQENDKRIAEEQRLADEIKKIKESELQKQRERDFDEQGKEIAELQRAAKEKMDIVKGNAEAEKLILDNLSKDVAAIREKYRLEAEAKQKEIDDKKAEDDKANNEKRLADEKAYAEQTIAVTQAIEDSKISIAQQGAQLLNQVAGQSKGLALAALAIEKGAAIASVIINTQRAIAGYTAAAAQRSALTAGATTAFDTALATKQIAGAKISAGINIASIAAAGINGARNISSGGGSGSGGGSVQPPNIRGSQTSNEQPNPQPTKVFVTETDIRSVTRKVDGIFTQATII